MTRAPSPAPDPYDRIAAALPSFEDADHADLRRQSLRDPVRGTPLKVDEHELDPGQWKDNGFSDPRTGLPPRCPVIPLGRKGDLFYFLNTSGQVHELVAASFGKGPIEALFGGRSRYLEWAWPRWSMPRSKTESPRVKGYEADDCRRDLIDACSFKGTFELADQVRGRGCWRGDDGGLIYHAGDRVWIDGAWREPGEHGGYIYPARARIGRPAPKPAEVGEGAPGWLLLEALGSWNWARGELDQRLALGWAMTAMVGGALGQRPVCFVPGPEGAGKSTLQHLFRALLQGGAVCTANATPAFIYQTLGQDTLPVMSDEMEAKEDTRTTDRIIELARVSFSGDELGRGGQGGVPTSYRLRSSFLFSCIASPPIDAQDASRRLSLEVRHRTADAVNVLKLLDWLVEDDLIDAGKIGAVGAKLLKRWLERWSTFHPLRRQVHDALMTWGHSNRSADAFAPVVAAQHLALSDAALLSDDEMAWWRERLTADILAETAEREDTWRRCFWFMLEKPTELLRTNNKLASVGSVLNAWRVFCEPSAQALEDSVWKTEAATVRATLERAGLSISFAQGDEPVFCNARLWVPMKHPALYALFEGSNWAGRQGQPGPWYGVLMQAPAELWKKQTSRLGLNRAAKGLMFDLAAALALGGVEEEA